MKVVEVIRKSDQIIEFKLGLEASILSVITIYVP